MDRHVEADRFSDDVDHGVVANGVEGMRSQCRMHEVNRRQTFCDLDRATERTGPRVRCVGDHDGFGKHRTEP